jgi:ATP-dependent Lon protease
MTPEFDKRVREVFGPLAVDKRRLPSSSLTKLGVPAYVAEWILEEIVPGNGTLTENELATLQKFASQLLPRRNEQNVYRNRLLGGGTVSLLAYMNVEVDLTRTKQDRFARIPVLGFSDCWISDAILENNESLLRQGMWGIIELTRRDNGIEVGGFEPMQASVNIKEFYMKRGEFSDDEWRELMLSSCGYNPGAYGVNQQIYILSRLLPLVQKNMHLMELAPKGTGKSFIYENISPRVYLTSGNITPAVLFINNATGQEGLLARYDVVVIDEVQKIKLEYPEEVISNLKIYLANGRIRRGGKADISSDCALVMLANVPLTEDLQPDSDLLVQTLPRFMHETAFLDRFRGIIPGWRIPKFHQDCVASGLGLKADFFSDALTSMRYETHQDEWVRSVIGFPEKTPIRDQEAVVSIASGLVKILYPNLQVTTDSFINFCLQPAIEMRQLVRNQLWQLDAEYRQGDKQLKATLLSAKAGADIGLKL